MDKQFKTNIWIDITIAVVIIALYMGAGLIDSIWSM